MVVSGYDALLLARRQWSGRWLVFAEGGRGEAPDRCDKAVARTDDEDGWCGYFAACVLASHQAC